MTFEEEFQRRLLLLMRERRPDANLPDGTRVDVDMSVEGYDTSGDYAVISLSATDSDGQRRAYEYGDLGALIRDLSTAGHRALAAQLSRLGEARYEVDSLGRLRSFDRDGRQTFPYPESEDAL